MQPVWGWRAFGIRFAIALAIVGVATASSLGYAYWFANEQINRAGRIHISDHVLAKQPAAQAANYLIVGSDSRSFVHDKVARAHFGDTRTNPENLADVIMIAHVDSKSPGKGFLVSIPRDTWVDVRGHGHEKINAAFNQGSNGAATLIQTIHDNFHVSVNHYLKVDFLAFTDIVNAIGHVHIYFPAQARDVETGLLVEQTGCVALGGLKALAYARSREYQHRSSSTAAWSKVDPRYDLGRIQRQQYFMRSLAQEAIKDGVRSPLTARRILEKVVAHLTVDQHMGLTQFLNLVRAFNSVNPGDVQMFTVPTDGAKIDGQDVQLVRQSQAPAIFSLLGSFTKTSKRSKSVAPSQIKVQVLNGSNVKHIAATTQRALEHLGFANGGTPTDADRHDYQYTEVRYPAGHEDEARVVASYLGGVGLLVKTSALGPADVVVVTGQDLVGVGAPGHTHTTSTATTAPPNPGGSGKTAPRVGCA